MNTKFANLYKLSIFPMICALMLLIYTGCGRDIDQQIIKPDIGPFDPNVVTANTKFGFNLFNEIQKTEQNNNIFISPFSVSVALAMTLNGAADETEQAMTNTLQLQSIDAKSVNPSYAQLNQTLQASDPKVTLTIANSLWARQDVPFKQDFLKRNTDFFEADISTLDFMDPNTVTTINDWVNTNTNGKIPKILERIDPDAVLFLINTIYFKGEWKERFDPSNTRDEPFYLANGKEKSVPMMQRLDDFPYLEEANFQGISLPYGDGQVSMYIFLPSKESELNTFLENLNAENWEKWIARFNEQEVRVQIPKFKLEFETSLVDTLKALGMEIAFDKGQADFSRMAPLENLDGNLFISRVDHKAIIEVDEEGTVAAAVTNVGIGVTSLPPPPPEFIADRPFFFAIRDNETKTVLFMGTVVDPQP